MWKKVTLVFGGLFLSSIGYAEEYRSAFGYTANLPSSWVVLSQQGVKKAYQSEDLASLGLEAVDRDTALEILQKVKSGQVEFYFDKVFSGPDFRNNISVQFAEGETISNAQELKETCSAIPEGLARVFNRRIRLNQCTTKSHGGVKYTIIEYSGGFPGITTIQNEFALSKNKKLVVVGGSNKAGLAHLRAAQTLLVKAIATSIGKS